MTEPTIIHYCKVTRGSKTKHVVITGDEAKNLDKLSVEELWGRPDAFGLIKVKGSKEDFYFNPSNEKFEVIEVSESNSFPKVIDYLAKSEDRL